MTTNAGNPASPSFSTRTRAGRAGAGCFVSAIARVMLHARTTAASRRIRRGCTSSMTETLPPSPPAVVSAFGADRDARWVVPTSVSGVPRARRIDTREPRDEDRDEERPRHLLEDHERLHLDPGHDDI